MIQRWKEKRGKRNGAQKMSKKDPIHPGEIVRHDCLEPLELAYDLARARQHEGEIHVRRYKLVPA